MYALVLALASSLASGSVPATDPVQNGEELHVACGLTPADNRFNECASTALYVMMEFAQIGEGSNEAGGDLKFCLPRSTVVSVENVRPLIDAYRTQYAREPVAFAAVSPSAAFLRAMRREWPCAGGR